MRKRLLARSAVCAVGAVMLLAACSGAPQRSGGPVSSETGPRPPGTPSVFPFPIQSAIASYRVPDFTITPVVSPNTNLTVGTVITLAIIIRNFGAAKTGSLLSNVHFDFPNQETTWTILSAPKEGHGEGAACNMRPPGIELCGDTGYTVPYTMAAHATKVFTVKLRLKEFRCPGGGDFTDTLGLGIEGPAKRGPAFYNVGAWFENDAQDYTKAEYASSPRPSLKPPPCKPQSVDLDVIARG